MKKWVFIFLIGVFSVAMTRLATHYLSYHQLLLILFIVALVTVAANLAIEKFLKAHRKKMALLFLSMDPSGQKAYLESAPEAERERILSAIREFSPDHPLNRTRAKDARGG